MVEHSNFNRTRHTRSLEFPVSECNGCNRILSMIVFAVMKLFLENAFDPSHFYGLNQPLYFCDTVHAGNRLGLYQRCLALAQTPMIIAAEMIHIMFVQCLQFILFIESPNRRYRRLLQSVVLVTVAINRGRMVSSPFRLWQGSLWP